MAFKRRLSGEETPTKCYEELVPSFKRMRTADPTAEQDADGTQQQHAAYQPGYDKVGAGLPPVLSPSSVLKSAPQAYPPQPLDQQHQQQQQQPLHQQQQEQLAASVAPMNALLRQLHFERLHRHGTHASDSHPSS